MRRILAAVAVTLMLCLSGCRTIKEQVPVYIHDTTQVVSVRIDSVYVDRWHVEYRDGDTVRIRDSVLVVRLVMRTDTAYRVVERPVTVTVTKEVARPLTWWQKTQKGGFWVLLAALVGYVLWRTRRVWMRWL